MDPLKESNPNVSVQADEQTNAPIDAAAYVAQQQPEEIVLTEPSHHTKIVGTMVGALAVVVVVALGVGGYATFIDPDFLRPTSPPLATSPASLADYPSFSEVATVESSYAAKAEYVPVFIPNPAAAIGPSLLIDGLTFDRVQTELGLLQKLAQYRSPELTAQVVDTNVDIYAMWIGEEQTLGEIVSGERVPKTKELLDALLAEVEAYAIAESIRYDVAPPQYYDDTLAVTAAVPPAPQFPDVTAARAFTAAFLLARLDPLNADVYLSSAQTVVDNRETAGVSFDISTKAGAGLAERYFEILPYSEAYQARYEAAAAENLLVITGE